jgi:hypothetical protein
MTESYEAGTLVPFDPFRADATRMIPARDASRHRPWSEGTFGAASIPRLRFTTRAPAWRAYDNAPARTSGVVTRAPLKILRAKRSASGAT